jgi:hypothetical protein
VPFGPGLRAPSRFLVEIREEAFDCFLDVRVGSYRRAECEAIRLAMKDGSQITWETLRTLPLSNWMTLGLTLALEEWDDVVKQWLPVGTRGSAKARVARLEDLRRTAVERHGSRRPNPPEFLERVAGIYLSARRKPIAALQDAFPDTARSTINNWVSKAREAGLIEPSTYQREEASDG